MEKGHSVILQCEAEGDPSPTIMWLKDSLPIDLSDPRIRVMDPGEFSCLLVIYRVCCHLDLDLDLYLERGIKTVLFI